MPKHNGDGTVTLKLIVWYIAIIVSTSSLVVNIVQWSYGAVIKNVAAEVRVNTEARIQMSSEISHINESILEIKQLIRDKQ